MHGLLFSVAEVVHPPSLPEHMKTFARLGHVLLLIACAELATPAARAQSKGVPIEAERATTPQTLLDQAELLRTAGMLLKSDAISAQLAAPVPGPVQLVKARTKTLRPREVAERARTGAVHVGWYYLCPRCDHWHAKLLGGYAIARDTVVTAQHCVEPDKTLMREGYFIAVDASGQVHPVTAVLAKSKSMDAAILRVGGGDLTPLALNDNVAPGDAAYCLSDPLGQNGYFSEGIVNRFLWLPGRRGEPGSIDELKLLRVNVSTEWAPGSSGAAVLDDCGNVIGHVATISPLAEGGRSTTVKTPEKKSDDAPEKSDSEKTPPKAAARDRFNGAVLITLHAAVPARGVLALVRSLNESTPTKSAAKTGSRR